MYDIPELEKKWKKWKRKQVQKPIIFGLVSLVAVSAISFGAYMYLNSKPTSNKKIEKAQVKKEPIKSQQTNNSNNTNSNIIVITKRPINSNIQTQKTAQIVPQPQSQVTVKNNADETIDITKAQIIKPNVPDEEVKVIGFDNKEAKKVKDKYKKLLNTEATNIIDPEAEHAKEVEERFKETQDVEDSLYLAKYYYKKGDYAKAESWAITTNNIDGDIEESWLIFAKARAKQGRRVDAIKVLQTYYDETKSKKAKELLDKLRLGKPF